jgi:Tfp pilus assembly protein PilX
MSKPRRPAGFLLLPVTLMLAVIGALSFVLVQDIGTASRPAAREAERARLLAEAGIAQATWQLNQLTACSGYGNLPATTLGSDQYQVTVSPTSGSPVTLTATATLGSGLNGSRATLQRQVHKTAGSQLTYTLTTDTAGSDTYLDANNPAKNYGGSDKLVLQQGAAYPLLQFDLSALPAGSRIVEAKLLLYRSAPGSLSLALRTVEAYRVLEPWVAGTKNGATAADGATWNTRDGSIAWQSAAGTIETASALDVPHTHAYIWLTPWMEWNITSLVQGWVDGRYPNYGLMLRPTSSVSTEQYSSAEAGDSTQFPKLVIKYLAPCGSLNPPQDGLTGRVAWWKFNESSGASAADAIANHTGTVTGGTWSPGGGVSGGALAFNSAGKVTVADAADIGMNGDFSLAAWVNMSNRNGKRPVLYKGSAANEANYAFGSRDGDLYFEYFANNAWQTFSTSGLNLRPGTFYHLAVTYKSSTRQIKLYLDGSPVGTFTASFGVVPKTNSKSLMIGSTPYNENFLGRLEDVQIIASTLDLAGVATAMGGSVRIPTADARISNNLFATNNNYGASTPLFLQNTAEDRSLLRFDTSGIAAGTNIKRAILSLHVENTLIVGFSLSTLAYPLKESWVEGTQNGAVSTTGVSWVKRQITPALAWGTQGGTYDSTLAGSLSIPIGAATQRYWEMDITTTVQEWVDGVRPNNGLVLLLGAGLNSANISSRESLHQEPRLVISTQ